MIWSSILFSYFYPRPPRGGRHSGGSGQTEQSIISIHALREEGDHIAHTPANRTFQFLSTPSARRATPNGALSGFGKFISIHALREEGDSMGKKNNAPAEVISIHALREEGDAALDHALAGAIQFLSTPSARRATSFLPSTVLRRKNFYPRPPRGGRHVTPRTTSAKK